MKTLHIYSKWIMVAIASLLISSQAQALALDPSGAVASISDNSNLNTLSEINSAFGTSYADLMLLRKGETGAGSAGQGGLLIDAYRLNVGSTANSGTIDYEDGEESASGPSGVASVAEPGTLSLMSLGLLGLAYSRKRRLI
jgi:hypothetical protein